MSHLKTGSDGEKMAAAFLIKKGYCILASNWRTGHKEIDLIAEKDGIIVFVEVKTRSGTSFGWPEEAVSEAKQENLLQAASIYLEENAPGREFRFDIISVVKQKNRQELFHICDAFIP